MNDAEGRSQGWTQQEGQPEDGSRQEGKVELCKVCGQSDTPHAFQHTFTPPGTAVDTSQFTRKRRDTPPARDSTSRDNSGAQRIAETLPGRVAGPFDPVLRQALLDKGILTVDDLETAQRIITLLTEQVTRSGSDG